MMKQILLVGLGGAAGSVLRYLAFLLTSKYFSTAFPLATFLVNIVGCFLFGMIVGYLDRNFITNSALSLMLLTGFCGAFTTFSTFSHENLTLLQSGNFFLAVAYIGASIFMGLLAVWLGQSLVK